MTTSESQLIALFKKIFDALNAGDLHAMRGLVHPDICRMEWEGTASARSYRGVDAFLDHVKEGRDSWAEGSCTPEKFYVNGDKVVASVHVHVRQHGQEKWIDARVADAFIFKDDKATEFRSFFTLEEALNWAQIK